MSDLPQVKVNLAALTNEDLFKIVNQDIVAYEREEISLAYDELDRRGMAPTPKNEKPPVVSPVGCLLGVVVLILEFFLTDQSLFVDKEFLPFPRAAALAMLVAWIASYWNGTRFHRKLLETFLVGCGSSSPRLVGAVGCSQSASAANPVIMAFGIPGVLFAVLLFWLYEYYFPRARQNTDREKE